MNTFVRYNQLPALANRALNRDFNRFLTNGAYTRPVIGFQKSVLTSPATNSKEDDQAFYLEVAAPGLKKENFTINVENKTLTIAYKNEVKEGAETVKYTHKEFGLTAFERSFYLPKTSNVDQIQAIYTDGILTVSIPKVEVKKVEPRAIEVL